MRTSTPSMFRRMTGLRWLSDGGVRGATRNARRAIERRQRDQVSMASLEARLAATSGFSPTHDEKDEKEAAR